jgi:phosphate uptake regulator
MLGLCEDAKQTSTLAWRKQLHGALVTKSLLRVADDIVVILDIACILSDSIKYSNNGIDVLDLRVLS